MGRVRTLAAVCLALTATAAPALPLSPSERVHLFATCTGRYAALAEHLSLWGGPDVENAAQSRDRFEDLLNAALPDAIDWGMPEPAALSWRLTAKMRQKHLLAQSVFHQDPDIATRSRHTAETFLRECQNISLGA